MKISGIQTKYGANQSLSEIVKRYEIAGSIVMTYDHPSWLIDQIAGQTEEESDAQMEAYFNDPHIKDYTYNGKYVFTIWEPGVFQKYLRNLSFSQSFLIWFSEKYSNEAEYRFELKNWKTAIFGYEGKLFYEVFSTQSEMKLFEGEKEIDYPGSINGSGGLDLDT